jgi:ABC-type Fe3+-hydroxamate transport system substrate-binding protein
MSLRVPLAVMSIGITACAGLQTGELAQGSQCGESLDLIPVNQYQGEVLAVPDREDAVVLINGSCTGTLIAAAAGPVVLTAGHCVGLGDQTLLAFNVEANPDGDRLVTNGVVIERADEPDYALIDLDAIPAVTPTLLTTRTSDLLTSIQHPRGGPKAVAEGRAAGACHGVLYYTDLDTLVGSSGAGVLNRQGHLVAVHSDGNCAEDGGGANMGWTAQRIVQVSSYLEPGDIADR